MKNGILIIVFALYNSFIFGQTTLQYELSEGNVFLIKQTALKNITQENNGSSHEIINKMKVDNLSVGSAKMVQLEDTEIPTIIKSTIIYQLIKE